MFNLCDVLQFVVDRFNDGSFSQQQFVGSRHQGPLHVFFQLCDELYAIHEVFLKQFLADVPFVTDKLPVNVFDKILVFQRLPVIDICRREHEVEQFTFFIAYQMQLKPKNHPMEHFPLVAIP